MSSVWLNGMLRSETITPVRGLQDRELGPWSHLG